MKCDSSCACDGQLDARTCPLEPGCKQCTHIHLIQVHFHPIDLRPGESIDERVQRDDMLSQLPPDYRQSQGRMN